MKPGFGLWPLVERPTDKCNLIKLACSRDICDRHLITAEVSILGQAVFKNPKRALEHDAIEVEFFVFK